MGGSRRSAILSSASLSVALLALLPRNEMNRNVCRWGLTPLPGGEALVATDGSDKMYHLEPDTLETLRVVQVKDNGRPVKWVNELEQIGQEVWANIWHTECIARIDPWNGNVQSWCASWLFPSVCEGRQENVCMCMG